MMSLCNTYSKSLEVIGSNPQKDKIISAIEAFNQEYGYYPICDSNKELVRILKGKTWINGQPMPNSIKWVSLYSFKDGDLNENDEFVDSSGTPFFINIKYDEFIVKRIQAVSEDQ